MKYARLWILFTVVLASCIPPQPSVYLPTPPQAPLLKKEGEFRLIVSSVGGSNSDGATDGFTSLEAAYAAGKHLGLIANVAYSPSNVDSNNTAYLAGEAGAGYFDTIQRYGRVEAYGGIGFGHIHTKWTYRYNGYSGIWSPSSGLDGGQFIERDASFVRPFVQATLGAEGAVAAAAFTLRASYLSVSRLRSNFASWDHTLSGSPPKFDTILTSTDSSNSLSHSGLFIEPEITFRIGYQPIKLTTSIWWSYPAGKDPPFLWADVSLSIGLSVELNP